jgi:HEAT repeat protein
MHIKSILKKLTLAGLLASTILLAQTPYDEGQKALREQRWVDAASQFEQVIEANQEQADAAMYWKAYAYYKAGRDNEAERELRKLERSFPDSRWMKEAMTLRVEHQGSEESIERLASDGPVMDEELRLFALSQLMERDPERAMPMVLDMMRNGKSEQVRRDAMFVLGMSEQPEAWQLLADAARNSNDTEMQIEAIHMLGTMDASDELLSIYPGLQSNEAKIAVVEALSMQGDTTQMIRFLENETDPEVRKAAIFGLAMDGGTEATEFVISMYDSATSNEEKSAILESMVVMDGGEAVALKILKSETDPELQSQAIEILGINNATSELAELYANVGEQHLRSDIIEALAIADDTDGLFNILGKEQNPDLRADAIEALAMTDSQEAADYLVELYPSASRDEKEAIIESMLIMDNTRALLGLMKQESDPELQRQMLETLTMMDTDEANDYLFEMLEHGQ